MFMENGAQTSQLNMYFDNGSLVATPEPASLALVGMGLASFYLIRRRKS
jgi:flagellar basal body rod protein FlgG